MQDTTRTPGGVLGALSAVDRALAAAVWMTKGHFSVGDWISKRIPGERGRRAYRLLLELLCLAFAGIFFWYSLQLALRAGEVSSVLGIPKKVHYAPMPISAAIMIAYSAKNALLELAGVVSPAGTVGSQS